MLLTNRTLTAPAWLPADGAIYSQSSYAALHAAVSADYARRWPDLIPPTLADCEAFCAGASLSSPITDTPTT